MLCQNCGKNEANTHIKQIINGDTAESHLCSECANHLGYSDMFSGFDFSLSDFFGGFLSDVMPGHLIGDVKRCEKCGASFNDIVREGRVGCANCYRTFYDRLRPSLQRIHGKARHSGKISRSAADEKKEEETLQEKINALQEQMNEAVAKQDFEKAAEIRDEIKVLKGENNNE